MKLLELIQDEYIWINKKFKDKDDIFKTVSKKALNDGKVKDSFYTSLSAREKDFPTGLNLGDYAIAIPHTDSEHVITEFVSIIIPDKTVSFRSMEDPDEIIYADAIFLMALSESEHHLTILREIMSLIQDESMMNALSIADSVEQIIKILERVD